MHQYIVQLKAKIFREVFYVHTVFCEYVNVVLFSMSWEVYGQSSPLYPGVDAYLIEIHTHMLV